MVRRARDRRADHPRARHGRRLHDAGGSMIPVRIAARMLVALACAALPPAFAGPAANDGDWPMAARDYASTRFSPLAQVTRANVGQLKVEFTFSTGVNRGQEAAPIVVGNTMYIVAPYPNFVYALDLAKPGAPQKWVYKPKPEAASQGVACCDVV